eukprot:3102390-Prymnesium_polylepis.1
MPRLSLTPESYCEHGTPSCSFRLVSRVACVHAFPDGPDQPAWLYRWAVSSPLITACLLLAPVNV